MIRTGRKEDDEMPARRNPIPASVASSMNEGIDRRFRVLMIAPTSFFADYGCHVRIYEEAHILQKLGHTVTIATYHNGNDVPGLDIRRTLPIPWRQHYEVGSSRHKIAFDGLLGLRTLHLLTRERFDIIHTHLHEGALIGLVLGHLFRKPVLFDFQGSLTEEMIDHHFLQRDSWVYGPLRRLENWINLAAPAILTSSVHANKLLVNEFGCRPDRIQTLPDCVNGDTFQPAGAYSRRDLLGLRQRLGIPQNRKLIVYLGLLAEHQGISHLLEAVRLLLQDRQNVHLLLMGFPNESIYRQKAKALGIESFVTLTGRVPYREAPRYLALGDVAVAPKLSQTEGAGKLLNYMAVGLPTVAFDTPVAREYLGLDGLLAPPGDVVGLAEQIRHALDPGGDDRAWRERLGQRLRQRALNAFSWETAGRQIETLYGQLLGDAQEVIPSTGWVASRD